MALWITIDVMKGFQGVGLGWVVVWVSPNLDPVILKVLQVGFGALPATPTRSSKALRL